MLPGRDRTSAHQLTRALTEALAALVVEIAAELEGKAVCLFLALLCVLGGACGLDYPMRIVVTDPALLDATAEAAATWNEALGREVYASVELGSASDDQSDVVIVERARPDELVDEGVAYASFGARRPRNAQRVVRVRTGHVPSVRVMTHELGHLLGIAHSENPRSVMASPAGDQITPDDVRTALNFIERGL